MARYMGLIAANESAAIAIGGNYLFVNKSAAVLQIGLIGAKEETHFIKRGGALTNKNFSSIEVLNTSAEAVSVDIMTGVGDVVIPVDDLSVEINTGAGAVLVAFDENQVALAVNKVDVANSSGIWSDIEVPAGQLVTVFAASASRLEATVTSLRSNVGAVRVAPHAGAAVNVGDELLPRGGASFRSQTEVTAFNASAESVWLSRNELRRV